ncbi:hypothetical protein [Sutcliffiella rhizosphaerae]|uniref:Nuclear transport factor 2 family protein n=1 Tax=Sutcliffiella rhizosphaerae TaxID=2880967 RepID=A0ABM8YNT3_9BACI|nr:hypothetical protein [Sutcliffiella rhizosphaerae]CAG9621531.1 hypothetical protein BACCIP111883_02304 [Sutcliffiella rhizosphaerae]
MIAPIEGLTEFTKMHDSFMTDWNVAMSSGDTSLLERMTEDYYVAYFTSNQEKPLFFNRQEAVDGMRQSVKQLLGAKKKFENRVIRLRNNENAVVFYELLIIKNDDVLAKMFTIENWKLVNEEWMIVRETVEAI